MICDCVGLPGAPAPAYFPEFKSASPPPPPPQTCAGSSLARWESGSLGPGRLSLRSRPQD